MINNSKLTIIITVFTISFIGYNVLTVDASTAEVTKEDIRKMKFVNDDLDDYGLKHIAIEQACKDTGGDWKENNWCKFDKIGVDDEVEFEHQLDDRGLSYFYGDMKQAIGGDEEFNKYEQERYEKSQKGVEEYEKYVAKQEEIAAQEDALCDNEDADTTNIKTCMSDQREQQMENIDKACDKVDGKMTKDGCETDHDGPKADKFDEELTKIEEETGYPSIKKEEPVIKTGEMKYMKMQHMNRLKNKLNRWQQKTIIQ